MCRKAVQCGRDGSCVKFRQRNGEKNFQCDLCMKRFCQKFSQYFLTMNKNIGALMCVLIILWGCRTTVYQSPLREMIRTTLRVTGKGCSGVRRHLHDPEAAHYEITNEESVYFFYIGDAVHFGFIPHGQRINEDYYLEMLKGFAYLCLENTGTFPRKLPPRV